MATIDEIRHANLLALVGEAGGQSRLAEVAGKAPSLISQYAARTRHSQTGKRRAIGDDMARQLEAAMCKPPGWMDMPHAAEPLSEYAGEPAIRRPVPVVGEARLGPDGYYDEMQYPTGHGDGTIEGYSSDTNAYALRVRGDSMHPAIRHGAFVVVEPNGRCVPGEYVALQLRDGRKMVKELVIERAEEVVVESVNGGARQTIPRAEIERMHPVAAVVAASKWRPAP